MAGKKKTKKIVEPDANSDVPDRVGESVTLNAPFSYAFRGLDVVTFAAGEYEVVADYDPDAEGTIPAEVVAVLPSDQ